MASIALAARAYQHSFDSRPHTTLALTNGAFSGLGDAVAQLVQIVTAKPVEHEDAPKFDPQRTLRFFTFGFAMGPLIGRWNKFLEHRFPLQAASSATRRGLNTFSPLSSGVQFGSGNPGSVGAGAAVGVRIGRAPNVSGFAVAKRVAADQLIMAPLGLGLFLASLGAMEAERGHTAAHVRHKFVDLYASALAANWQMWPLAQIVNFRYMPLAYRVPFQATCGVFWNLYLSLLNARGNTMERDEEAMRDTLG
ncbi:hypothetical protein EW145_g7417 [Phellinidium pouzarii]|uniref:Uncharacterized protein n=1 Tax=Phellinidium pouzarii TaxID=167371 RepID=A0A4S4KP25_9AGAM|nr:hypothetical protein EW145_g7417 [Phellinidium pouzarii]